jgi:transposase InsO family protein
MADRELTKFGFRKLGNDNYPQWRIHMRGLLQTKDIASAITEPEDDESDKAKGLITLCVQEYHLPLIEASPTAHDAWTALEQLYQQRSSANLIRLKRELANLEKRRDETVMQYVARARGLADQITAAGQQPDDADILQAVLAGLPSKFAMMRTILESLDELPSLTDATAKLMLVECDRPQTNESAYVTNGRPPPFGGARPRVYVPPHRRQHGSKSSGAPGGHNANQRESRSCYYCGKKGHLKKDCRKRKADMNKEDGGRNSSAQVVALTATDDNKCAHTLNAGHIYTKDPRDEWAADSGATEHVTGFGELLHNATPVEGVHTVTYGNGEKLAAVARGDIIFKETNVVLQDVLYVPGNRINLLSVSKVVTNGANVVFTPDACVIKKEKKTVMKGIQQGGLYKFRAPAILNKETSEFAGTAKGTISAEIWHKRYGHLGYDGLKRLVKEDMVKGINLAPEDIKKTPDICKACAQAKHSRSPFGRAEDKTTGVLDLVHMDICGPLPEETPGGKKYFITFLDDYSRYSDVVLLELKSDAKFVVKNALEYLERQSGKRVKGIRTDNGGEFISDHLKDYLKEKGINHQKTVAYTPEQNGRAERLNRTLMEKTRAMMLDSNLPQRFWGEALTTANYLRNVSPTVNKDKTPYELFYGHKPDVSFLRAYGSEAYCHIPKEKRNKLAKRSEKGNLIGYMPNNNGYRIWMEGGFKIWQSRDVIFDETKTRQSKDEAESECNPEESESEDDDVAPDLLSDIDSDGDSDDGQGTDTDNVGAQGGDGNHTAEDGGSGNAGSSGGHPPDPNTSGGSTSNTRRSGRSNLGKGPGEWWRIPGSTAMSAQDGVVVSEPLTLKEAMDSEHADYWKDAVDDEYKSLLENNTWTLEVPPTGVKPIPVKWVFKIKKDATGRFERFKARLVVKGYRQKEGVDFNEVFAPVSKYSTLRTLLAKVTAEDMEIHQVDIKTAFLHGELEEEIYIEQPEGYEEGPPGTACKLNKSLYGLKQAPRAWFSRLNRELEDFGFKASDADPSLFTLHNKANSVYLLVYVDDILIAGDDTTTVNAIKQKLLKSFQGRDLGEITSFLGINISRDRAKKELKIDQKGMIKDIIEEFGMEDAKPRSTPMSTSLKLTKNEGETLDKEKYPYGTLVGKLMFLAVATRPDLAYTVGALTRFMANPTIVHWQVAKDVVRYLAKTPERGITFRGSNTELKVYCDADYAGDIDTRRSTTGYVFMMSGGATSWNSKRQPTVAVSTTEAEYMAAAAAVKEGLWMRKLLESLNVKVDKINIMCDNQSAIKLLKNPIFSVRSKHIDVIHHFARERVLRGDVVFNYIHTKKMLADVMTKALPTEQHEELCAQMGVV